MKEATRNLWILFGVFILFIANKFLVRPYVLANEFPDFIDTFVLSFPNLCEAVYGCLLLTNIGLSLKSRFSWTLTEQHIYLASILITAVYVLTQELKIHNLGGRNVYDPYDLVFSVIGLLVAGVILRRTKPVESIN